MMHIVLITEAFSFHKFGEVFMFLGGKCGEPLISSIQLTTDGLFESNRVSVEAMGETQVHSHPVDAHTTHLRADMNYRR